MAPKRKPNRKGKKKAAVDPEEEAGAEVAVVEGEKKGDDVQKKGDDVQKKGDVPKEVEEHVEEEADPAVEPAVSIPTTTSTNTTTDSNLTTKKKPMSFKLTPNEEEVMAAWFKENRCLYDKREGDHHNQEDPTIKDRLYEAQGLKMGRTAAHLSGWVRQRRTAFTKLMSKGLDDDEEPTWDKPLKARTNRDLWTWEKFSFLFDHVRNRVLATECQDQSSQSSKW